MKQEVINDIGCSRKGTLKRASYKMLVSNFGIPAWTIEDADYTDEKVTVEFTFSINGSPVTVYDYKKEFDVRRNPEEITDWSIGAKDINAAIVFVGMLRDRGLEAETK